MVFDSSQISLPDEDPDELTGRRLMADQRPPAARIIKPVAHIRRGADVAAKPVLDRGRAIPLSVDVQADPQRVLKTVAGRAKRRVGPAARPDPFVEIDTNHARRPAEARDGGRTGPASQIGW